MSHIVVFKDHTARVVWNPEDIGQYNCLDNVLVNPDLTKVENIPMEFWKKSKASIVPMSTIEMIERSKLINSGFTEKSVDHVVTDGFHKRSKTWAAIGMVVGVLVAVCIFAVAHGRH